LEPLRVRLCGTLIDLFGGNPKDWQRSNAVQVHSCVEKRRTASIPVDAGVVHNCKFVLQNHGEVEGQLQIALTSFISVGDWCFWAKSNATALLNGKLQLNM